MIEKTILIDRIESESNREHGGDGDIKILAEDMKRNGLINPITIKAALADGAEAAIFVSMAKEKIQVKPVYWKTVKEDNGNVGEFSAELKLLDLPKQEAAEIRKALKAKKTSHWSFMQKVQEEVFWRLMEYCAAHKDSFKWSAEFLLRDALSLSSTQEKKIFKLFTGKDSANTGEILKLGDQAVFTLLYALSLSPYEVPPVFSEKMESKAFEWADLPKAQIKELYREAIKKLLPKPKAGKKEKTK